MFPLARFLTAVVASAACFAFWKLFQFAYPEFTSPLRHLRGPKSSSLIYGNVAEMNSPDRLNLLEGWVREHGSTLKYHGLFNRYRLITLDTRAVDHVLTHSGDYQKQSVTKSVLSQIFGQGLLIVEGARHRQQNPGFGPGQIRELTDIFLSKAVQLRDIWSSEIAKSSPATPAGARLNVVPWLTRTTLDVIGLAGFNYDFEALNADKKPSELNEVLTTMIAATQTLSIFHLLEVWIPPLRLIPTGRKRKIEAARRTMARISNELLAAAKAAACDNVTEKGEIEKDSLHGRDLLTLLIKANMATDIPESQRLSDEDVLAQIPTFVIAGHETTSTAVSWALYAIARDPEVQTKLREELLSVDTETPSMDDLMGLPYLDAFLRETLRMYPPVPFLTRVAMKDDVLPVEKPFTDKYGAVHDTIRVSKGDVVTIHISAMNRSKELWGPDAHEFRPERWTNVPEAVSHIPGVWGHVLTFFGGPRACIGYRFSLVEAKAILFTLVRTLEFTLAVPASEVGSKPGIQQPTLRSDPEGKAQLPLLVRPYQEA